MFRRLIYLLGIASLVGVLFPTTQATASGDPFATAVISGSVADKDPVEECTTTANGKKDEADGTKVLFNGLEMAGIFGNADNQFIGRVVAKDPVEACSAPRPGLPFPADVLTGYGYIQGGEEFNGDPEIDDVPPDKCLRGEIGDPAKANAGDFNNLGTVALVKFEITFWVGDFDPPNGDKGCVQKKSTVTVTCVGTIGVVPRQSLSVGPQDDVVGAIVCHPILNALKNGKTDDKP